MRSPRLARLTAIVAVVCLGACSSSHKSTPSTTTTTSSPAPATTTTPPVTTTRPAPATTSAPTVPPTTTPPASAVRIVSFTGPPSPVECNARNSQIQLHWTTQHATSVSLAINGRRFATYPNGTQDPLEPLTCDGTTQTYTLTARAANGATASRSLRIAERALT